MSDFIQNNMVFIVLLSGHLAGDFLFQTDSVYAFKSISIKGQILHAMINGFTAAIAMLIVFPSLLIAIIAGSTVLILHFIIDHVKILIKKKNPLLFLLDQGLHIGVLFLIAYFTPETACREVFIKGCRYIVAADMLIVIVMMMRHFVHTLYYYAGLKPLTGIIYRYAEYAEKSLVFFFAYMHSFFFILIPIVLIPRMVMAFRDESEVVLMDILFSMIVSALGGIFLRKMVIDMPLNPIIFITLIAALLLIMPAAEYLSKKALHRYTNL